MSLFHSPSYECQGGVALPKIQWHFGCTLLRLLYHTGRLVVVICVLVPSCPQNFQHTLHISILFSLVCVIVFASAASGPSSSFGQRRYDSLEEIHVFLLAHVLRRPIIVVADEYLLNSQGEKISPIHFGGIYLPLLIDAEKCHSKVPLLLGYDALHFAALAPVDSDIDIFSIWKPNDPDLLQQCQAGE